jgi:hypothetical protein
MNKNKVKRIIAREGLIIIAIVAIFELAQVFLFSKIDFSPPMYKIQLSNGSCMYVAIYPEIHTTSNSSHDLIAEMYNPSLTVVKKRIKEFTEMNRINCVNASRIRSWRDAIKEQAAYFLTLNIVLQGLILYLSVSILRFIIWAVRMLRESECHDM